MKNTDASCPPPFCTFNYLSDAPHAVPHAAGFSSGLSAAPHAVPHAAGLSAAPHAVPHAAAVFVSDFLVHPKRLSNDILISSCDCFLFCRFLSLLHSQNNNFRHRKKVRTFLLHSHLFVTTYFIKKDPAYYPDRQPPGRAVDIPVLSYNKAKIPGPTHCQDSAPQS